jgi:anti-sigma factor RsiW
MSASMAIDCTARDAYIDGELSALESAEFDRHAADCPACRQELERGLALRTDLRRDLTRYRADAGLQARIFGKLPAPAATRRTARQPWLSMALAASLAAVVAGGSTFYATRIPPQQAWADAVLDGHLRATMSGHVFDVASSDRHTVKPWFSGKTAVAPVVVDLAAAGYPLLGGRLDILSHQPLPVLVYGVGPHVVSVVVRPGVGDVAPDLIRLDGFSTLTWRMRGFEFSAVSDADAAEIEGFQRAFAKALAQMP